MTIAALQNISRLTLGNPQHSGRITVIPMLGELPGLAYMTLADAIQNDHLEVTEISSGETVSELEATNRSDNHILILEGEELIGAMQNRVMNTSVMLSPTSTTRIPVSCVESGRWSTRSDAFADSDELAPFTMRSGMNRRVFESLRMRRTRDAGQGEVWSDVDRLSMHYRTSSNTSAMKDTSRNVREEIDREVEVFDVTENQLGSCIFIDDRIAGLEVLSDHKAFRSTYPKILRSYAIDSNRFAKRSTDQTDDLVKRSEDMVSEILGADWEEFDAVGVGKDLRLKYSGATGSALALEDEVLHLSVMNSSVKV